jgi:hypothetical protein
MDASTQLKSGRLARHILYCRSPDPFHSSLTRGHIGVQGVYNRPNGFLAYNPSLNGCGGQFYYWLLRLSADD